jgi:hypothetical protein
VGAYKPGTMVSCREWSTNRGESCGCGLHIGSLEFAKRFGIEYRLPCIVKVFVRVEDIVCVPAYSFMPPGKVRCKKLLVELGFLLSNPFYDSKEGL